VARDWPLQGRGSGVGYQTTMEEEQPPVDPRALRAARSLYINRHNREVIDGRIERAREALITYLGLNGLAAATFGVFDVELAGDELHVTKREVHDAYATQLALPPVGGRPHEEEAPGYGVVREAAAPLYDPEDGELLLLLRRFVADISRTYEARTAAPARETVTISSPADAYHLIGPEMSHLQQEQLRVLNLNRRNHVLSAPMIYQGNVSGALVRVAEVFRPAVIENASGIIVAHNHPSGDVSPSPEDIRITRQLVETGRLLDVEGLDHIIIAGDGYASLRERGLGFER